MLNGGLNRIYGYVDMQVVGAFSGYYCETQSPIDRSTLHIEWIIVKY